MKAIRFSERTVPLFFLVITIVAYGLLLPVTGFYWDDWPFAWMAQFLGPFEFIPAFEGVRPFLGPIFFLTTGFLPPVPLYWQIFALVIRFLAVLSAWFALRQIWPQHRRQTFFVSLLFLVFPGYSQHWVAYTHINQEWIPFIFYLLSFGLTARALRRKVLPSDGGALAIPGSSHADTLFALLFLIAGVFPTEYFVSLEPLRFLFIWVIISERVAGFRGRLVQSLQRWWPYLLVWLANAAWLAYFYTIGNYASYEVEVIGEPLAMGRVLSVFVEAIWKSGFYIWGQILLLLSRAPTAPASLGALALILVAFVLILLYVRQHELPGAETGAFAVPALLVGLAGILLGRIPSFAAGLPLTLQSSFDRFMISMMLGASLFVAGLLELSIPGPRRRAYAYALLIALGVGQQFFNANIFRRDWTKQQEIYWQLAWRIPAMKPGTALLTHQLPIDYETDLSFTAPLNWIYAPEYERSDLPYALIYTEKRLGGATLPSLEPGQKITLPIRRVSFHGSTSQVLVVYMPPSGCLRVLDPERRDQITYSHLPHFLVDAIPLSDLSRILVDAKPAAGIPFLPEPEHTWCYYFARAELARQQGQWEQAVMHIEEATSRGFRPDDPFEWLTYIEAQARTGEVEAAVRISRAAVEEDRRLRRGLCEMWRRLQSGRMIHGSGVQPVDQILSELRCP